MSRLTVAVIGPGIADVEGEAARVFKQHADLRPLTLVLVEGELEKGLLVTTTGSGRGRRGDHPGHPPKELTRRPLPQVHFQGSRWRRQWRCEI